MGSGVRIAGLLTYTLLRSCTVRVERSQRTRIVFHTNAWKFPSNPIVSNFLILLGIVWFALLPNTSSSFSSLSYIFMWRETYVKIKTKEERERGYIRAELDTLQREREREGERSKNGGYAPRVSLLPNGRRAGFILFALQAWRKETWLGPDDGSGYSGCGYLWSQSLGSSTLDSPPSSISLILLLLLPFLLHVCLLKWVLHEMDICLISKGSGLILSITVAMYVFWILFVSYNIQSLLFTFLRVTMVSFSHFVT